MASSSYQSNCDVEELRKALKSLTMKKDHRHYQNAVQKVVAAMTLGFDVSSLFSEMVMACATTNLVQKKLVYLYLCSHAESQPDLALLTISTLCKDASSSNAMVRGLALRSMFNLRLPHLVVHMKEPIVKAIEDRSAYVRKTAVICCLKMYTMSKETFDELGLQHILRKLIFDSDPKVMLNAVLCLEEILAEDGGITLDFPLLKHLLQRLNDLESWDQALIMAVLRRYHPSNEADVFEIFNSIDTHLRNINSAVVMAAAGLFLSVSNDNVGDHVLRRLKTPMLSIINSQPAEVVFTALDHINLMIEHRPSLFTDSIESIFARKSDPLYVKKKRLLILTKLTTKQNVGAIISELRSHCLSRLPGLNAIQCLGQVAAASNGHFDEALPIFIELIELQIAEIYSEVMITFKDLLLRSQSRSDIIVPRLHFYWDLLDECPRGKSSAVWIISQFHKLINGAPYHLKQLIETVSKEDELVVKLLLTASLHLFWSYPSTMQTSLGQLLSYCIEKSDNVDVCDRALFYYRLLKFDIETAHCVVKRQMKCEPAIQTRQPANFSYFNSLTMFLGNNIVEVLTDKMKHRVVDAVKTDKTDDDDDVIVANILGSEIQTHAKGSLALSESIVLDAKQFELEWSALEKSSSFDLQLTVCPTPDELIPVLKAQNIYLMASGQQQQKQDCYFLYCQEITQDALVLLQLLIDQKTNICHILLKFSTSELMFTEFPAFFKNFFVGKWLAADQSE